jgi:hypothetical protein
VNQLRQFLDATIADPSFVFLVVAAVLAMIA